MAVRGDENNDRLGGPSKAKRLHACSGTSQKDIKALVRGDDFVSSGERAEVQWLCKGLNKKFETKMTMVGEDDDLASLARVLNRIARRLPRKGITYEADSRHAEIISRDTGAEKLETISTLAAKETGREGKEEKRQDLNKHRLRRLTTTTVVIR